MLIIENYGNQESKCTQDQIYSRVILKIGWELRTVKACAVVI